ncbi:glycoside hydrolase family 76 protein [Nakamurella endophytica]|uniref:Fructose-bisphosphate aldolase n=1 Tax=Nakamurella endophytica TaxID=1748367 RepID=A0A917TBQ9_9ACTN|nr:glycoside hydrolase family 76 protein [Nakamurella endophytica]GGM17766.1 hypothetical protein GCM10011594_42320 [Nakamurella endophytica]
MTGTGPAIDWSARADDAEAAVVGRSVRRLWALPATRLGVPHHPARPADRLFLRWNLWWQAHLLDAAVEAWHRAPTRPRAARIRCLVRGARLRNGGGWANSYLDDTAWWALALERASRRAGPTAGSATPADPAPLDRQTGRRRWRTAGAAVTRAAERFDRGWPDDELGGLPWRDGDEFRNAPANGPAAVLLARTGHPAAARRVADWIHRELVRPDGLVADGIRAGERRVETTAYSYVQGVVLGAELELVLRGDAPDRLHRLVTAVDRHLAPDGVIPGHGGADAGLFGGILARYLADVTLRLPGDAPADRTARATAGALVLGSADAAWRHRGTDRHGPVFGADWTRPAGTDPTADGDLSTQLSGWLLTEAAAAVTAGGPGSRWAGGPPVGPADVAAR